MMASSAVRVAEIAPSSSASTAARPAAAGEAARSSSLHALSAAPSATSSDMSNCAVRSAYRHVRCMLCNRDCEFGAFAAPSHADCALARRRSAANDRHGIAIGLFLKKLGSREKFFLGGGSMHSSGSLRERPRAIEAR